MTDLQVINQEMSDTGQLWQLAKRVVGQRWPCVLRRAALDSVSRVKEVLGSIPPATATEIK